MVDVVGGDVCKTRGDRRRGKEMGGGERVVRVGQDFLVGAFYYYYYTTDLLCCLLEGAKRV